MKKEQKFSMLYILLALWAVLLIQNYLTTALSSQVIPYSQFLTLLKEGKVSEVAITANRIEGQMKVEGKPEGGWILVDFGSVIVHLFSPDRRDYYGLEELWHEGKIVLRVQ